MYLAMYWLENLDFMGVTDLDVQLVETPNGFRNLLDSYGYLTLRPKRLDVKGVIAGGHIYGTLNNQKFDLNSLRNLYYDINRLDGLIVSIPPKRTICKAAWLIYEDPTPKNIIDSLRIERDNPYIIYIDPQAKDRGDYWDFTDSEWFEFGIAVKELENRIMRLKFEIYDDSTWFYFYVGDYTWLTSVAYETVYMVAIWDELMEKVGGFRGEYTVELYVPETTDFVCPEHYVWVMIGGRGRIFKEIDIVEEWG